MKDKYIKTIKQAGFQEVKIVEETQYSFEDVINDPNTRVVVANPNKNTQELKCVSELGEEAKGIAKEILDSTASIKVLGTKPPK